LCIGLSVQPVESVRRPAGVADRGDARRGTTPGRVRVVSLRQLRVAIASPDPELTARVADVVRVAGHDVTVATDTPFDAMEAAFSRSVEVLVLDQELQRLTATEVAGVVRSVGSTITVVVLHRGELAAADDLLVLDPTRPGFEQALASVLDRAGGGSAGSDTKREGRRAG
jgi:hypothetical protein